MQQKIEKLEMDKKANLIYIQSLEKRVEYMDKVTKSSCIEIRNIPLLKNESVDDLFATTMKLCKTLNVPVQPSDIMFIEDTIRCHKEASDYRFGVNYAKKQIDFLL